MPANDECQQKYLDAKGALDKLAKSKSATAEQRQTARQARDRLTDEFIEQNIIAVEARTAQFQLFITVMEETSSALGKNSVLPGMKDLAKIVTEAKALIGG